MKEYFYFNFVLAQWHQIQFYKYKGESHSHFKEFFSYTFECPNFHQNWECRMLTYIIYVLNFQNWFQYYPWYKLYFFVNAQINGLEDTLKDMIEFRSYFLNMTFDLWNKRCIKVFWKRLRVLDKRFRSYVENTWKGNI